MAQLVSAEIVRPIVHMAWDVRHCQLNAMLEGHDLEERCGGFLHSQHFVDAGFSSRVKEGMQSCNLLEASYK